MPEILGSPRFRPLLLAGAACAVAVACLVFGIIAFWPSDGAQDEASYMCESCGTRWSQLPGAAKCLKCGQARVHQASYQCATCRKIFVGLEFQKADGKTKWRSPGGTWQDRPPAVVCPTCKSGQNLMPIGPEGP